ncbi:MAG TPA: hotdog family protein [Burkholderiaceae bacterium]
MSLPDIRSLVPHTGTMVLLDSLVSVDADNLCAAVVITGRTMFCRAGEVGSWVGIEYMAQAIAAHAGWLALQDGEPIRIGFLLGSRRYECSAPAFTQGMVLHVHAHMEIKNENGLGAYQCRIEDASDPGQVLAQGTITVFQPENIDEFMQGSGKSNGEAT